MFKKITAKEIGINASVIYCEKCQYKNHFFYLDDKMHQGAYCGHCLSPIVCLTMENSILQQMFKEGFKMEDLDKIDIEFLRSIPPCPSCNNKQYTRVIYTYLKEPLNCFRCGHELNKALRKPIEDLSDKEFYWYEEDK